MGLFGSYKKRITKEEFRLLRSTLFGYDFTRDEIDDVEKYFHGDLHEDEKLQRGIDKKEIEKGIKWFRENSRKHTLSDKQVDILERELKERL